MCLDTVTKKYLRNKKKKVGYKVFFRGDESRLYGDYKSINSTRVREVWLNEEDFRDVGSCPVIKVCNTLTIYYATGFHFFEEKQDAEEWRRCKPSFCVCRCIGKDIRAEGLQDGVKVFVAKELFIMRREE